MYLTKKQDSKSQISEYLNIFQTNNSFNEYNIEFVNKVVTNFNNFSNQWINPNFIEQNFVRTKIIFIDDTVQEVGAFKIRGATTAINNVLETDSKVKSIVVASSGSFGISVANVCKKRKLNSLIYIPNNTPKLKKEKILSYDSKINENNEYYDEAKENAKKYAAQKKEFYYLDGCREDIFWGNGSIILELIACEVTEILKKSEKPLFNQNNLSPHVLMFVGVNGSGKTTTIGKLIPGKDYLSPNIELLVDDMLEQNQKRLEQEGKQEKARQRTLASELEWIRQSPRARQDKSKARISAYETLLAEAKEKSPDTAQINVPIGPRLGNLVIEAKGLRKGFEEKLLIDDLSFKLPPGGIIGVIGANGTGKTTLFRMIAGQDTPDTGSISLGDTVSLGYVDQSRAELDPDKTVWEEISEGLDEVELGYRTMQSRAYVSQFNFKGADQQKKVGQLSGGERNRVHLAKVLKFGANVILLDEPTNDLDVDTLRALEEALIDFPGCAVVISHDRWFLDRIATHILAFEGGSRVVWFEGNYDDYEKDWKRRLGPEAAQPHRVKYKPLTKS